MNQTHWIVDSKSLQITGRIYREGIENNQSLDLVMAQALKNYRLSRDERGVIVPLVQGMWRRRLLLETVGTLLPFFPSDTALAALNVVLSGGMIARGEMPAAHIQSVCNIVEEIPSLPLNIQISMPELLWNRFQYTLLSNEKTSFAYDDEIQFQEYLKRWYASPKSFLRANTLKNTRETLRQSLLTENIETMPGKMSPWSVWPLKTGALFRTQAFYHGLFEMQDEASQCVALLTGVKPGFKVIDLCAGAGGKTLAMASMMANKGHIIASDVAGFRLQALKERARRAGAFNITTVLLPREHEDLPKEQHPLAIYEGEADVVLLDAPCSGSGVIRRNPDIAWNWQEETLERLQLQQQKLLHYAVKLLKPRGRLLYATCSVFPEENEEMVDEFLQKSSYATMLRAMPISELPNGKREEEMLARKNLPYNAKGQLATHPWRDDADGMFAALMQKTA